MDISKTITAIIVDDEKNARENLHGIIEKHFPEINIIAETSSAIDAINAIRIDEPNLLFLDIEMPGGSGFNVLEHFPNPDFKIIFITAYDHYAIKAIRFSALDYILKPINVIQLKAAIRRLVEIQHKFDNRLQQFLDNKDTKMENRKIALPSVDKIDYVEIKRILRCLGESNYTYIFLTDGTKIMISKSLVEYEEILEDYGFIRTHKSHLVNLMHVISYIKSDGGYLLLSDKSSVPVSRRKKESVLEKLKTL